MPSDWGKLIVALDVVGEKEFKKIISELSPKVKIFKIGPIAYFKLGHKTIDWVNKKKAKVFLDFKLYDIPNTMLETAKNFVDMGVWAFTVHTKAGAESLSFLKKELSLYARFKKKKRPLIIGVTELTSSEASLAQVLKLAAIAKKSNIDGVVSSVWEAKEIKKRFGLKIITPGIRKKSAGDDQRRVASPKEALKQGADYFVVGRPIVKHKNSLTAAREIMS
jgi:orotidine-5'-phosphate decarboxylase